MWDVIEHGVNIEERKDRMTLTLIYQAIPEEFRLMFSNKGSTKAVWETLQTTHVSVERLKEAKVQTLNSDLRVSV